MDAAVSLIEADSAVGEGEESVIPTHPDVLTCLKFGAALANDDRTRGNGFTAETFHAEALATAIATVARRSLSFFMGHDWFPRLFASLDLLNFDPSSGLTMADGAVVTFPAAVLKSDDLGGAIVRDDFRYDLGSSDDGFADLDLVVLHHQEDIGKLNRGASGGSKAFNFKDLAFADLVLFSSRTDDGDVCHKGKEYRKRGSWASWDF